LTINKLDITISADDQSATYGDASLPTNTFKSTSPAALPYTDALDTVTYTYSTTPPVNAGSYTITPSAATFTTGCISNDTIHYVDGKLTIAKRKITVILTKPRHTAQATQPSLTPSPQVNWLAAMDRSRAT
jgi:hypothetical protein